MKKTLALIGALAAAGTATAQSATYKIEPTHTFVTFEAKHFGTSTNRGRFDKKEGTITIDPVAKTGKAEITIDMSSINTGTARFDGHLKSADLFNVEKFASATFVADKFEFDGSKVKSVTGQLTLLGKSAPLTLVASNYNCYAHPFFKAEACGGDFEGTIQRGQHGLTYGAPVTPDSIRVVVQIEAIKQP